MSLFDKNTHRDEFRLRILMTDGCNKNCSFCLNDFQPKPKGKPRFLELNDARKAITAYCDFMHQKGMQPIITFSGGEPGIHPRIHDILPIARKHGAFVKVATNGTALYLTQLKDFVDCWHVSVTRLNFELVEFLDANLDYNVQIQLVLYYNAPAVLDLYGKRGLTIKLWGNFFHTPEQKEEDRKTIENLAKQFPEYKIISRFTGKQENRGEGCKGCTIPCVTLKALWVFPDGTVSTCPQGYRKRWKPGSWLRAMQHAYEAHKVKEV